MSRPGHAGRFPCRRHSPGCRKQRRGAPGRRRGWSSSTPGSPQRRSAPAPAGPTSQSHPGTHHTPAEQTRGGGSGQAEVRRRGAACTRQENGRLGRRSAPQHALKTSIPCMGRACGQSAARPLGSAPHLLSRRPRALQQRFLQQHQHPDGGAQPQVGSVARGHISGEADPRLPCTRTHNFRMQGGGPFQGWGGTAQTGP